MFDYHSLEKLDLLRRVSALVHRTRHVHGLAARVVEVDAALLERQLVQLEAELTEEIDNYMADSLARYNDRPRVTLERIAS